MNKLLINTAACFIATYAANAVATVVDETVITFDDAIAGETSHFFDGDGDGAPDVVFSTTDPLGFNTAGPGSQQLFVDEPGLEGATELTPDLRVDFLYGAVGSVGFGFATISPTTGVFQVFDEAHNQIASQAFAGDFFDLDTGEPAEGGGGFPGDGDGGFDGPGDNVSFFPEGRVDTPFAGTAAYAIIDFNPDPGDGEGEGGFASRYIIDNFTYTEGDDALPIFEGADPDIPVLPDPFDPENPEFSFELEILEDGLGTLFPIFIDPIIAIGYTYTVDSGPLVASVEIPSALPNGDGDFIIVVNGIEYALSAGTVFDIFAETGIFGGVDSFEITGIDTAELLDPNNGTAFVTGLTFVGAGTVNVTQTPITVNTDVPEPGTLLLLSMGLLGFASARRKYRYQ